ncbi:MAG: nucleotidyltransferase domain-containing protein [Syntrophaceae bacterium]
MNELLEKIFCSKLRVSILALFFSHSGEEFYPGEIASLINEDRGNITRELANLEKIGILTCRKNKITSARRYYSINFDFLLYKEFHSIFLKTTGAAGVIREAISKESGIDYSFIYGSVAAGMENVKSDIDLMIVGDISLEKVSKILDQSEDKLGRNINPAVFSLTEFKERRIKNDPFISRLMKEPKIFLKEKDGWLRDTAG